MSKRECASGHEMAEGTSFCTQCGKGARQVRRWVAPVLCVAVAVLVGAGLGWASRDGDRSDEGVKALEPTTSVSTLPTTELLSTTAPAPTPTAPPEVPTTSTTQAPPAVSGEDPAEIARQVAVVYFTFGVNPDGYPSWEELIAPEAWPSTESQVIPSVFKNADCTQIVKDISMEPTTSTTRFEAWLTLSYSCEQTPIDPMSGEAVETTDQSLQAFIDVGPSPGGGLWGTGVEGSIYDG